MINCDVVGLQRIIMKFPNINLEDAFQNTVGDPEWVKQHLGTIIEFEAAAKIFAEKMEAEFFEKTVGSPEWTRECLKTIPEFKAAAKIFVKNMKTEFFEKTVGNSEWAIKNFCTTFLENSMKLFPNMEKEFFKKTVGNPEWAREHLKTIPEFKAAAKIFVENMKTEFFEKTVGNPEWVINNLCTTLLTGVMETFPNMEKEFFEKTIGNPEWAREHLKTIPEFKAAAKIFVKNMKTEFFEKIVGNSEWVMNILSATFLTEAMKILPNMQKEFFEKTAANPEWTKKNIKFFEDFQSVFNSCFKKAELLSAIIKNNEWQGKNSDIYKTIKEKLSEVDFQSKYIKDVFPYDSKNEDFKELFLNMPRSQSVKILEKNENTGSLFKKLKRNEYYLPHEMWITAERFHLLILSALYYSIIDIEDYVTLNMIANLMNHETLVPMRIESVPLLNQDESDFSPSAKELLKNWLPQNDQEKANGILKQLKIVNQKSLLVFIFDKNELTKKDLHYHAGALPSFTCGTEINLAIPHLVVLKILFKSMRGVEYKMVFRFGVTELKGLFDSIESNGRVIYLPYPDFPKYNSLHRDESPWDFSVSLHDFIHFSLLSSYLKDTFNLIRFVKDRFDNYFKTKPTSYTFAIIDFNVGLDINDLPKSVTNEIIYILLNCQNQENLPFIKGNKGNVFFPTAELITLLIDIALHEDIWKRKFSILDEHLAANKIFEALFKAVKNDISDKNLTNKLQSIDSLSKEIKALKNKHEIKNNNLLPLVFIQATGNLQAASSFLKCVDPLVNDLVLLESLSKELKKMNKSQFNWESCYLYYKEDYKNSLENKILNARKKIEHTSPNNIFWKKPKDNDINNNDQAAISKTFDN